MVRGRIAFAAIVLMGAQAGLVGASNFGEEPIYVEGYLDSAPAEAEPIETVQITHDGRDRVLIVVTARSTERPGAVFGKAASELPLQLRGPEAEVSELMESREGARVRATVKYYPASRAILLQEVGS